MTQIAVRCSVLTLAVLSSFLIGAFGGMKDFFRKDLLPVPKEKETDFAVDVQRPSFLGEDFSVLFLREDGSGFLFWFDTQQELGGAIQLPYHLLLESQPLSRWMLEISGEEQRAQELKRAISSTLGLQVDRYLIAQQDFLLAFLDEPMEEDRIDQLTRLGELLQNTQTDLSITEVIGTVGLLQRYQMRDQELTTLPGEEHMIEGERIFIYSP